MSKSRPIIAGFLLLFLGVFIGTALHIYSYIPSFDKVLHFTGGLVAAWFITSILYGDLSNLSKWKKILIIASCALTIGVVWEFVEYLTNVFTHNGAVHPLIHKYLFAGSLPDTLGDLAADLLGGILFGLIQESSASR
ncbi:DUF2238 domain-containing protein [Candidatus Parcubacteria bacterium]|nr:DUF2238 domain-containing protein [Candidatus Parcubacteria bacterium]